MASSTSNISNEDSPDASSPRARLRGRPVAIKNIRSGFPIASNLLPHHDKFAVIVDWPLIGLEAKRVRADLVRHICTRCDIDLRRGKSQRKALERNKSSPDLLDSFMSLSHR